jgi:polyhydroxyalkanoate synthase
MPDTHDSLDHPGLPGDSFDRWFHAQLAQATAGISPSALQLALTDWLSHLALSPAKQAQLVHKAWRKALRLALYLPRAVQAPGTRCIEPLPQDHRFDDPAWAQWPFNVYAQSFLLMQQWWHNATTDVRGVERHHEDVVSFVARQLLDLWSPGNFVATHPAVLQRTLATGGANLWQGALHAMDDVQRLGAGRPPAGTEGWIVGETLATTPGTVVMRNPLAELIRYEPAGGATHAEPVLIVPAWIMKFYVLDLSPGRSLIEYLVGHGHAVYCLSWKNPTPADRDVGLEDYLRLGVFAALDTIGALVPNQAVHAAGYCLGGTLLAIAAADMAARHDRRLASITLLAAQTDFSEPGEIGLFIDESEVTFLEDLMADRGVLEATQMAGAFQLLRSNDLVWSRGIQHYLLGERTPVSDLMAWNADATRMPGRMHAEYLRRLFLHNELATARFPVGGRSVALNDIRAPLFVLGTEHDHVAPWRSVYKMLLACDADAEFVLASGGHNTGIVSPPDGRAGVYYRRLHRPAGGAFVDPEQYLAMAQRCEGSWWGAWQAWLVERSHAKALPASTRRSKRAAAPAVPAVPLQAGLGPAPGRYVMER